MRVQDLVNITLGVLSYIEQKFNHKNLRSQHGRHYYLVTS